MPKRSIADFDNDDITLEPAHTSDVPVETAMLYPDILHALFISAARMARDRHEPTITQRLLRGAARIEAWRSDSPVTADRFPPPQISPAASPQEPSPVSDDDPDADDSILAFQTMLGCAGCAGCNAPYRGCWEQLSLGEQQQRRMEAQHD